MGSGRPVVKPERLFPVTEGIFGQEVTTEPVLRSRKEGAGLPVWPCRAPPRDWSCRMRGFAH